MVSFARSFSTLTASLWNTLEPQANDELTQSLQDLEQKDVARFERLHDEWDRQNHDPDDVFFHALERRQEIKEQMKDLQHALKRQRPRKSKKRRA